jgi:hypothetical protein
MPVTEAAGPGSTEAAGGSGRRSHRRTLEQSGVIRDESYSGNRAHLRRKRLREHSAELHRLRCLGRAAECACRDRVSPLPLGACAREAFARCRVARWVGRSSCVCRPRTVVGDGRAGTKRWPALLMADIDHDRTRYLPPNTALVKHLRGQNRRKSALSEQPRTTQGR